MDQEWFEMKPARKKNFNDSVWIPLRAIQKIESSGEYGYLGFKEEFFGCGSLFIPVTEKEKAIKLTWGNIGINHNHGAWVDEKGDYFPSDIDSCDGFQGIHPVLDQHINSDENRIWILHQDIVIYLGLTREGNSWISPNNNYEEVARILYNKDSKPILLEIKNDYIKDYLCARKCGLYLTTYRERKEVVENINKIAWGNKSARQESTNEKWEGRILEIHEGGKPFGESIAVFHAARTDVDPEEDVPVMGPPSDKNIKSKSWKKKFSGRKLFIVWGELWKNEWVPPGNSCSIIDNNEIKEELFFFTDADGKKESNKSLDKEGRWLWFKADVVPVLANRRGGSLFWYTGNTGGVKCSPDWVIHFGINKVGLINVYAKDIAELPTWQQKIWAGYNVKPDSGVSEELLDSQVKATPARTKAPEAFLKDGRSLLDDLFYKHFGVKLFLNHPDIPSLLDKVNRFRSCNQDGFFSLAKDITRLFADAIDTKGLQKVIKVPKGQNWGSLKTFENFLQQKLNLKPELAKSLVTSLVGIYELRLADSHLPSSKLDEAYRLAGVDKNLIPLFQGYSLLHNFVSALYAIIGIVINKVGAKQ